MSAAASTIDDDDEALIGEEPVDPELIDPPDAAAALGRGLALAITNMRPILATELAATWATSDDPVRRLAIAYALEYMFPLVGDALIIEHLLSDEDPLVRTAIGRAAEVRRASLPPIG